MHIQDMHRLIKVYQLIGLKIFLNFENKRQKILKATSKSKINRVTFHIKFRFSILLVDPGSFEGRMDRYSR